MSLWNKLLPHIVNTVIVKQFIDHIYEATFCKIFMCIQSLVQQFVTYLFQIYANKGLKEVVQL